MKKTIECISEMKVCTIITKEILFFELIEKTYNENECTLVTFKNGIKKKLNINYNKFRRLLLVIDESN